VLCVIFLIAETIIPIALLVTEIIHDTFLYLSFWSYLNLQKSYHGNIVDLFHKFSEIPEKLIELASDQTSLHNPYELIF